VSDTTRVRHRTTLTHIITLNYVIFSNYQQCWRVIIRVVSGVRIRAS